MFLLILLVAIAVVAISYLFFYSGIFNKAHIPQVSPKGNVCFRNNCFSVEVAHTQQELEKGLMFRQSLDKDKGMLFVFPGEGIYPFWMKNTLIPLDIIWIDSNNKVVFIAQDVKPCKSLICPSVVPTVKANRVLEINAGICKEVGLAVGNELKINID